MWHIKEIWILLIVSDGILLLCRARQVPITGSERGSESGHPRIYFAEIDAKYSGPKEDIINGWKHLGELVSAEEGIWTSGWDGEPRAFCSCTFLILHKVQQLHNRIELAGSLQQMQLCDNLKGYHHL